MTYVCPCRICPNCGARREGPHPEDGLAYCHACSQPTSVIEWWAVSGPRRDGAHIRTERQEAKWRRFDAVMMETVPWIQ